MEIIILNSVAFVIGIKLLLESTKKILNGNRSVCLITLILFEIEYVIPLIVETVWYVLQLHVKMFPPLSLALCDTHTSYIYFCFVMFLQVYLYILGTKSNITIDLLKNPKISRELFFILKCLRFLPVVFILMSPTPLVYFRYYAPFTLHRDIVTESAIKFHTSYVSTSCTIAFLATMAVHFFRLKSNKKQLIVQYLSVFLYSIINGKRTILAFSVLGFIVISVLRTQKINLKKIILPLFGVIVFFALYSILSGKGGYFGSAGMNILMTYIMYFDRAFVTKIAIFEKLNPELVHILDYPFQTILFNLFFWIPRSFWSEKPYPYAIYFTSGAVGNKTFYMVPWRFQTSVYAEWISNIGIISGVFFYIIIYTWFVKETEKKKSFVIYFIGLVYSCFLQMFEFTGTPQYFIIMWTFLVFLSLFNKRYFVYNSIIKK